MVTAVIVAHDGAAWLQHLVDAVSEQTRPVQRVVAVDTGSRDRSGAVLAAQLGQGAVFGMDRSAGYAAAVRRAVQHKAASSPVPAGAGGSAGRGGAGRGGADQAEWLWLLHDDCEPAADALQQLLRGAAETPTAGVLGAKLMDWTDRDVIVEAGVSVDTVGRRITGIEPREVDQGQHDGDRDVLAVSSAGMLIRRDVWDQVGGFDPGMTLFGEDVDFCWRVHAAGHRVRVITDAVVFHAAAASKGRRAISVGRRARLLERRNGLVTLLGNLPAGPMAVSLIGNLALSLLRTVFYLIAKRPTAALDESAAVLGVAGHPLRLAKARRLRARGRRAAFGALRADLMAGHSIRRAAEFAASVLSRSSPQELAGAHHASDDPDDDESLLTDSGVFQRLFTRPGVLLVLGLMAVAIAAERSLITSGTLGGGALVPAFEGASGLWTQFLQAYHPVGVGSTSAGPPYVGFLALLSTVLLGKPWLAIDVLLLGCVPLAGCTAFLALRRVTLSVPVRVWAAASYALLPVAFGAISAGRLGSAVAFVLIPVIGMLAGRMFSQPPKIARRAAWATGLTITVVAAFVPVLWPMAVVGAVLAGLALRRTAPALFSNLAIVVGTPLILLLPWLIELLAHPSRLLLEIGLQQPGLAARDLPAKSLLLLSPGGPGLPPYWVSAALVLAGLVALLASRRLKLVVSGWIVALLGFAVALLASRTVVTAPGGPSVNAWPGVALEVAAAGLLLAAAAAADSVSRAGAGDGRAPAAAGGRAAGGRAAGAGAAGRRLPAARRAPMALLGLVACTAPVLAAGYWLMNGVSGPIGAAPGEVVPSIVSTTAGAGRELRTLVLTGSGPGGRISYLLLRGDSPEFSYPDVSQDPSAQTALNRAVAALVAPGGGEATNQSQLLAEFDVGFVLMRAPLDGNLVSVLDGVTGLTEVSKTASFDLWRLSTLPSRVSVVEPSGAVVAVGSGSIGVSGAPVPAAGGTVLLSEPSGGWSAAVNGHALSAVASPAGSWAQAFKLPSGGGTLTISRDALLHNLLMIVYLIAFVVVAALALPGIRSTAELEAAAAAEAIGDDGIGLDDDADDLSDRELVRPGGGRASAGRAGAGRAGAGRAGVGRTGLVLRASRRREMAGAAARMGRRGRGGDIGEDRRPGEIDRAANAGQFDRSGQPDGAEAPAGAGQTRSVRRGIATALPARLAARTEVGRSGAGRSGAGRSTAGRAGATAAGAAGAVAGSAGAAAGAVGPGAAGAGTAGAGAAGAGFSGAAAAGTRPGRVAAAWPAGQPVSRFVSGPPNRNRPDEAWAGDPYATGQDPYASGQDPYASGQAPYGTADTYGTTAGPYAGGSDPYAATADPAWRTPSGSQYGEPARRAALSPSGTPYDEPAAARPAGNRNADYGGDAGYSRDSGYGGDSGYARDSGYAQDSGYGQGSGNRQDSGYGGDSGYGQRPGYGQDSGNRQDSGYGGDSGYGQDSGYRQDADYGQGSRYDQGTAYDRNSGHSPPGYDSDRGSGAGYAGRSYSGSGYADRGGYSDPAAYGGSGEEQSAWPSAGQQQGWPEEHQPSGSWPQHDQQRGWPSDYQAAGESADRGWYPSGQEAWSDQPGYGDALEALPPAEEVHHDWSAGRERGTQGWPAPGQDEEGEGW